MELYPLKVFLTVASEKSFSRAAEKMLRTQPAISLAIQKLESDLQESLIDRSGKELLLTDAGRIVYDYARRFENLSADLENALSELRDNSAGPPDRGRQRIHVAVLAWPHRALSPPLSQSESAGAPVIFEQNPIAVDRRRSGARRHQLRPGRRAPAFDGHLHRSPGLRRFPAAPLCHARPGVHQRARHGNIYRPQCPIAHIATWC